MRPWRDVLRAPRSDPAGGGRRMAANWRRTIEACPRGDGATIVAVEVLSMNRQVVGQASGLPPGRFARKSPGSWSQCIRKSERRLSMNRQVMGQASRLPRGRLAREWPGSWSLCAVQRPSKLPTTPGVAPVCCEDKPCLQGLSGADARCAGGPCNAAQKLSFPSSICNGVGSGAEVLRRAARWYSGPGPSLP